MSHTVQARGNTPIGASSPERGSGFTRMAPPASKGEINRGAAPEQNRNSESSRRLQAIQWVGEQLLLNPNVQTESDVATVVSKAAESISSDHTESLALLKREFKAPIEGEGLWDEEGQKAISLVLLDEKTGQEISPRIGTTRSEMAANTDFYKAGVREIPVEQQEDILNREEIRLGALAMGADPELAERISINDPSDPAVAPILDNWSFSHTAEDEFNLSEERSLSYSRMETLEPWQVLNGTLGAGILRAHPEIGGNDRLMNVIKSLNGIDEDVVESRDIGEQLTRVETMLDSGRFTQAADENAAATLVDELRDLQNKIRQDELSSGRSSGAAMMGGMRMVKDAQGHMVPEGDYDYMMKPRREFESVVAHLGRDAAVIWVREKAKALEANNSSIDAGKYDYPEIRDLAYARPAIRQFSVPFWLEVVYRSAVSGVGALLLKAHEIQDLQPAGDLLSAEGLDILFKLKIQQAFKPPGTLVAGVAEAFRFLEEYKIQFASTPKDNMETFLKYIAFRVNGLDDKEATNRAFNKTHAGYVEDLQDVPNFWAVKDAAFLFLVFGRAAKGALKEEKKFLRKTETELKQSNVVYPIFRLLSLNTAAKNNPNILKFFREKGRHHVGSPADDFLTWFTKTFKDRAGDKGVGPDKKEIPKKFYGLLEALKNDDMSKVRFEEIEWTLIMAAAPDLSKWLSYMLNADLYRALTVPAGLFQIPTMQRLTEHVTKEKLFEKMTPAEKYREIIKLARAVIAANKDPETAKNLNRIPWTDNMLDVELRKIGTDMGVPYSDPNYKQLLRENGVRY